MDFVIIDETSGAATGDGATPTAETLQAIALACEVQLNRDFAGEYGGSFRVRVGDANTIVAGECVFAILPKLPDAPGAIAYHDVNGQGVPVLYDGITLSDTLIGEGNSLSVAISHELLETAGDEACNQWVDDNKGNEFAREMCDAVEATSYEIEGVQVSNFVLRAFFIPNHAGPFDMGKALSSPFDTAIGGYQIARSSGTGEHQVHGNMRAAHLFGLPSRRPVTHPCSRRARRGVPA